MYTSATPREAHLSAPKLHVSDMRSDLLLKCWEKINLPNVVAFICENSLQKCRIGTS